MLMKHLTLVIKYFTLLIRHHRQEGGHFIRLEGQNAFFKIAAKQCLQCMILLDDYHCTWTDAWTDNANPRVASRLKNEFLTLGRKVFLVLRYLSIMISSMILTLL